jgi:AsmA protein
LGNQIRAGGNWEWLADEFRLVGNAMKRLALVVAVLLVFAGTSLAGVCLVLSPGFLTEEMRQSVEHSTGKRLSFAERPRLAIWPEPAVVFERVRLFDSARTGDMPIADVAQMRVKISASALIGRRAELKEIRLINPKLNLVVDRQGRSNWSMSGPRNSAEAFKLPPIYIEGGTLSFTDQRSQQGFIVRRLDVLAMLGSAEGPLEIKGSADWQSDRMSFSLFVKSPQLLVSKGSPLDLNVSGTWLNFAFSGRGTAARDFDLAGTVEGGARSARHLLRWAGLHIGEGKGLGRLRFSGALSLKGKSITMTRAQFRLDGMRAEGEGSLSFQREKPRLAADLAMEQLDLTQYFMPSSRTGEGIERWNDAPIDLSALGAISVDAALRAERVTYAGAIMTDARIEATVKDGIFSAELQPSQIYGGKGKGRLTVNGAGKAPAVQLSFTGSGIDGLRLFRGLWNFTRIEGQTELSLSATATGRSQREMIASLSGIAGISVKNGAVRGIDAAEMVERVAENIQFGWVIEAEARSAFDHLKANFKISDGIAESSDIELASTSLGFKGQGIIDLLKGEIDAKVEPSGDAVAEGFYLPIVIIGPWAKPKFYPDIAGVLENPQAAYETLKSLIGRAKVESATTRNKGKGENAGGVAGEVLSSEADQGKAGQSVDLIKKELNTNTLELMNGFAGENPPEPIASEP